MLRALFSAVVVAAALLGAAGSSQAADAGAPSPLPACIQVQSEARYVPYGYNHIVHLRNGCPRTATCTVATDVNPQAQTVEVAAASAVDVTTFMGAAAQAFTAQVACVLK